MVCLFMLLFTVWISIDAQAYQPDSINQIQSPSITIASEPDYPPYCMVDKDGNAYGFSIDLFMAASKAMNIEVKIKTGIWNQIKLDLENGKIDALPLVGRTPEREQVFDFSLPYITLHGAVFVNKGFKKINTIDDLSALRIAVMKGDNADEYLHRKKISSNVIHTHTFEDAFIMLANHEVDAVVAQRVMGLELVKEMELKTIVPINLQLPGFRQDFCFAVKKGNSELLSKLNEGLSIIIANKTYDELYLKWFGPKVKENVSYYDIFRIGANILVPLIIISSLILIILLRRLVKAKTASFKNEIIEHEKTNLTLHKQQLLLEKMEKTAEVGGWEYDIENNKSTWTNGVYCIYGVNPSEFDPSNKESELDFYHPNDREIIISTFQQAIDNGKPFDLELIISRKDGTSKWVWTSGQAEFINGKVARLFGSIMDVTNQKITELELERLKDELEHKVVNRTKELDEKVHKLDKTQKAMLYMVEDLNGMTLELKNERQKLEISNKELEAFSYSVSHDLRAPLRAIDGFSRLVLEDYGKVLDSEGLRLLDIVRENVQKMDRLITDLLSLSRVSRSSISLSKIDMAGMAFSMYHEILGSDDSDNIEITINPLPPVFADTTLMRQVWQNLIGNALKYSKPKEKQIIEINGKCENGSCNYSIKDNGVGFNAEYKHKIFDTFQRLHKANEFEGTGIGLSIVHRIITRHGGAVWADAKEGEGATFWFSLPVVDK